MSPEDIRSLAILLLVVLIVMLVCLVGSSIYQVRKDITNVRIINQFNHMTVFL